MAHAFLKVVIGSRGVWEDGFKMQLKGMMREKFAQKLNGCMC